MIELKNVTAGYKNHTVLRDLSLILEDGKLTSLIGVNGSGKSTLLKAALNMLPLDNGEVLIDKCDVKDMSRKDIARRVAYLSQGKSTPDMTVSQMVLHGRFPHLNYPRRYTKQDREFAFSAMEQMGISHLAEKPLYTLSGGMRQNAYIAMALAQDTDFILLDEPTTYLDIAHQIELMKNLQRLSSQGKGIVVVMHDLPMAFNFSNKIVVLDQGNIVNCGTPQKICEDKTIDRFFGISLECCNGNYFAKF